MNDPAPVASPVSVAARLDRLPVVRLHWVATAVIGLGLFFDLYENFLAATISSVLKNELDLSRTGLNLLLGSAFLGQFLGALVMGRFADRVGRRRAFMINLAIYSLFSVLGAFSPNATVLIITRFIAGVGIGAEFALADSYLSDLLPKHARGKFISWAYTVAFLGVPTVGLLAHWLVPLQPLGFDGWRWLFLLGGIGSFVIWVVRRGLPESPRWLETQGRQEEADTICRRFEEHALAAGHTLADPDPELRVIPASTFSPATLFHTPFRRRTVMLWILSVLEVFGYYGFGTLAPLVLHAKGFDLVTSLGFLAATYVGYPVGSLLAIPIVERVERKYLVMGSAAAMAAFGLWFGLAGDAVSIVVAGVLYTMVSNLFSNAYHVYLADSYPTGLRGTAAGAAYSLSKLATGLLPFLLLPVLDDHGSGPVFGVVAVAMSLLIVDVATLGHRSTGRSADATV
ncbi:MFS transporter [Williamsia sterculiae]|uniref:MFS transporter, putative metabolite:H+ symporter n=1 Tax=Williamsia sterculiae TaxID=1344003 RepID=A0A1N7DMB3_9NOCA|nr:MFS transporter [Williamsia sterculiae]SIR76911.1 MFS transporter, putative metabolite:H+ symporter [Williamsia sterculiae]